MGKQEQAGAQERMDPGAIKMRDFYAMKKDAPIYQAEFGYYVLDRWIREGHIAEGEDLGALFGFDPPGKYSLGGLGWCEAELVPKFEEAVLEDRGDYELVRDTAGRSVLYFKGRRNGFMPEYAGHPVKDMDSWEREIKWRMEPRTPERLAALERDAEKALDAAARGHIICQSVIGGYMYLRSLMGPLELIYMFYDDPALIHACMETWFGLADFVTAEHQRRLTLDELFLAEDICYKTGPLISPDMMREFLFPYYKRLIENIRKRQLDKGRTLHIQIDTDGNAPSVIKLYQEIGMDYMSPFEAAAGCDVVELRRQYPELLMRGGIDKRILAAGADAIDRELERVIPFMRRHGGYIPTSDHGVPEEVAFADYMHYRKRMLELGN